MVKLTDKTFLLATCFTYWKKGTINMFSKFLSNFTLYQKEIHLLSCAQEVMYFLCKHKVIYGNTVYFLLVVVIGLIR